MYLAPIYVYPVLAILLPIVFYLLKPKWSWLSILCAVVIEVLVYWLEFSYYESRGIMILFTIAQVIVMAIILLILKQIKRKN